MMIRFREERGANAVIVAILLVVLLGMLSLSVDGGFLYTKYRTIRNANDAAALAAGFSCANGLGQGDADTQATNLARANAGAGTTQVEPNTYTPSCDAPAGKVTVHYRGQQTLFFAQVVGVSSPKTVSAIATASWGGIGAASLVAPLMLSMNRLSSCNIPSQVSVGDHCFFFWDNGTGNNTSVLTNAEWGLMALPTWGIDRYASCTPGSRVDQPDVTTWITQGYAGTLALKNPPPTYVCRGSGFQGGALNNDINSMTGKELLFPVNDPNHQVDPAGNYCAPPPPGQPATCTVDKYAIVGFAKLEIVETWTGSTAISKCNYTGSVTGLGSVRCLEAIWQGYEVDASGGSGGQNFGLVGVSLTG